MTKIRYIGAKPVKHDNVADTGLSWHGAGDVQEVVDPAKAAKLLAHSLIWEEAGEQPKPKADPDASKTSTQDVDPAALHARATELGIAFKTNWGVPRLTKAIADAEAKLAKADPDASKTDPQA